MRYILLLATFIGFSAHAQTEETGIKTAISHLFDGMRHSDTAMIRSAFAADPILQSVAVNRDGAVRIVTEPLDSFIASVARPHNATYDERITYECIKIDGNLASVWTPYEFYLGNNFSHCGADSYQVVRINGQWKIQYLIDTRRKQDCR